VARLEEAMVRWERWMEEVAGRRSRV